MLGLDNTQVETLAEGWGFAPIDVATACEMAEAMEMELPTFVGTLDEIVSRVREHEGNGGDVREDFSASYVIYCYARAERGLPLL